MKNQYICPFNTAFLLNCQTIIHLTENLQPNLLITKSHLKKDKISLVNLLSISVNKSVNGVLSLKVNSIQCRLKFINNLILLLIKRKNQYKISIFLKQVLLKNYLSKVIKLYFFTMIPKKNMILLDGFKKNSNLLQKF